MIFTFLKYLKNNKIDFCLINGYKDVISQKNTDSDIDILFKKNDFVKIENIIKQFCHEEKLQMVQVLHHDLWAKNIFVFNPKTREFLNLDLYGELSRKDIVFFKENDIFNSLDSYENIPILSGEKEFIYYLVKKLDKHDLSLDNYEHLRSLYVKNEELCNEALWTFFPKKHIVISRIFTDNLYEEIAINQSAWIEDFSRLKKTDVKQKLLNSIRTLKRIIKPTGLTVSFLGPDGSGKSTIIDQILDTRLPFRRKEYFHLKPLRTKTSLDNDTMVTDPHKYPPYSKLKSYIKLLYFVYQYNFGWLKNIVPLKIKSSLVIFDRYFDDMLVDNRRYRYGGSLAVAKLARMFIPKPDLYFILTADAKVIYERKQEVPFEELQRQVKAYEVLADGKRYFHIDVNRSPEEITKEVVTIMMEKMHERY